MPDEIDLRSDTVTKPSDGMRQAMASAEVGDDVFGEDPTVNALQERCAALFGKEAALFVPSGTMANLLGLLSQTQPGETVLIHESGHAYNFEGGNVAAFGGLMTRLLPGALGKLTAKTVKPYLMKTDNPHFSNPGILSVENTTNMGGGNVYTPDEFRVLYELGQQAGVPMHCDGARIMNACVALGVEPADFGRYSDTITCCFSKGLGAPVGSILAGSVGTIARANRQRKMLGGGMRQAGVLAAAAMYALDHHVEALRKDHDHAAMMRKALEDAGIEFADPTPTNILFIERENAADVVARCGDAGLKILAVGPERMRVVFHRDVSRDQTERAIEILRVQMK